MDDMKERVLKGYMKALDHELAGIDEGGTNPHAVYNIIQKIYSLSEDEPSWYQSALNECAINNFKIDREKLPV